MAAEALAEEASEAADLEVDLEAEALAVLTAALEDLTGIDRPQEDREAIGEAAGAGDLAVITAEAVALAACSECLCFP